MDLILDTFRGYGIEYDRRNKIITINKEMSVEQFQELKKLLKMATEEIKDVRLYSNRLQKVRKTA